MKVSPRGLASTWWFMIQFKSGRGWERLVRSITRRNKMVKNSRCTTDVWLRNESNVMSIILPVDAAKNGVLTLLPLRAKREIQCFIKLKKRKIPCLAVSIRQHIWKQPDVWYIGCGQTRHLHVAESDSPVRRAPGEVTDWLQLKCHSLSQVW